MVTSVGMVHAKIVKGGPPLFHTDIRKSTCRES